MKVNRFYISVMTFVIIMFGSESALLPCGPPPKPPCARTIYLSMFAPWGTVPLPGAVDPVTVEIGVIPFVSWTSENPACAVPVSATLTLTMTCVPIGGGAPTVIGPQDFPVFTPAFPGEQFVDGFTLPFEIPAGTFPTGAPTQICTVSGTYTVTFGAGEGSGPISGSGKTEVYLVPPSPLDPAFPRLEMHYVEFLIDQFEDFVPFQFARKGDQCNFYFLIANNDPVNAVTVEFNSEAEQVAHFPDGFTTANAYAAGIFAISNPTPGTDTYPAAFPENINTPGGLLPDGDPFAVDPQRLTKTLTLGPGEAEIVPIVMRSYGMCADGSCNQRNVRVNGSFANGDTAIACVSTAFLVSDEPPKSNLCEFSDHIKAGPSVEAIWTSAIFGNLAGTLQHAETFFSGNLPDSSGFLTKGTALGDVLFPASASELLRIIELPDLVSFTVSSINQTSGVSVVNNVDVIGVNNLFTTFPLIFLADSLLPPTPVLNIQYNLPLGELMIADEFQVPLFQGPIAEFLGNPPQGFGIDNQTCRVIQKTSDFADKTINIIPSTLSKLFHEKSTIGIDTLLVINNLTGLPDQWDAFGDLGLALPAISGSGILEVGYDTTGLPFVPQTTLTTLFVSSPGAINNDVQLPVAIRILDGKPFQNTYNSGWNLISLACNTADRLATTLYPNATANSLFSYNGSYQPETSLNECQGYWLNFPADNVITYTGKSIDTCVIDMAAGWNLIAGPSCDVALADFIDPGGIITPNTLFGFDGAYVATDTVKPGNGYWLNALSTGQITLVCPTTTKQAKSRKNPPFFEAQLTLFSALRITDEAGASQTLYYNLAGDFEAGQQFQLPPTPPAGSFDARFAGDYRAITSDEGVVFIQASHYPVRITPANLPDENGAQYALVEQLGDQPGKSHLLREGQTLEIDDAKTTKFRLSKINNLTPTAFELHQNYPNPFNPGTTIRYAIPENQKVEILIYDILGRRVKTLLSKTQEPGFYSVEWDGKNETGTAVTSGVYFVKITAGKQFTAIKKMILLR